MENKRPRMVRINARISPNCHFLQSHHGFCNDFFNNSTSHLDGVKMKNERDRISFFLSKRPLWKRKINPHTSEEPKTCTQSVLEMLANTDNGILFLQMRV